MDSVQDGYKFCHDRGVHGARPLRALWGNMNGIVNDQNEEYYGIRDGIRESHL